MIMFQVTRAKMELMSLPITEVIQTRHKEITGQRKGILTRTQARLAQKMQITKSLKFLALMSGICFAVNVYALACPPIPQENIVPGYIQPVRGNIFPGNSISQVIAICGNPNEQRNYQMQEINLIRQLNTLPNISYYNYFFQMDPGQFQSANFSVGRLIGVTDLRYGNIVLLFVGNKWIGTRYLN